MTPPVRHIVKAVLTVVIAVCPFSAIAQVQVDPSRLESDIGRLASIARAGGAVYDLLTREDARYEPDAELHGIPSVPINCDPASESEDCYQCIKDARAELEDVHFKLEKLRAIYINVETMVNDAKAFGDSYSSLPGQGLGWYAAWRNIQSSWQKFKTSYDEKAEELMDELQRSLMGIARCEEIHYGVTDWYSRFGFIYYAAMETRYDRLTIE